MQSNGPTLRSLANFNIELEQFWLDFNNAIKRISREDAQRIFRFYVFYVFWVIWVSPDSI